MRNLSKKALAVMLAASMLLSAPMTAFAAEEEIRQSRKLFM